MPRGDRTGPAGMGPMTGRGAGYCAGYNSPGYANPGGGFGMGFGGRGGGGRGRRNWYYATGVPGWARFGNQPAWGAPPPAAAREQEVQALRSQQEALGSMLENIQARLRELEDQG